MLVTLLPEAFEGLQKVTVPHPTPSPEAVSTDRVWRQLLLSDIPVRKKGYILRIRDNTTGLD